MTELYLIMLYNRFDGTSKLMAITMDRDVADKIVEDCLNDMNEDQTLEVENVIDLYINRSTSREIKGFDPVEKEFIRVKN